MSKAAVADRQGRSFEKQYKKPQVAEDQSTDVPVTDETTETYAEQNDDGSITLFQVTKTTMMPASTPTPPDPPSGDFDPSNPEASGYTKSFHSDLSNKSDLDQWAKSFHYDTIDPCMAKVNEQTFKQTADGLEYTTRWIPDLNIPECRGNDYNWWSAMHLDTYHTFSQFKGYFEAVYQPTSGTGTLVAWWLIGVPGTGTAPNTGSDPWPPEMDIYEGAGDWKGGNGQPTSTYAITNHYGPPDASANRNTQLWVDAEGTFNDKPRKFGCRWEDDKFTFYIDDELVKTQDGKDGILPTEEGNKGEWKYYLILSQYSGGDWAGTPDKQSGYQATTLFKSVTVWAEPAATS